MIWQGRTTVWSEGLVDGGGRIAGMGLLMLAGVHLFRFICTFLAGRWDVSAARSIEREALADKSIANRLKKLEDHNAHLEWRFAEAMRAIGLLADRVRRDDPFDPTLVDVAEIIASCFAPPSRQVPPDMTEQLREMK